MSTHTITPAEAGKRLDHVLPGVAGTSRAQIQKAIKAGAVLLDGKRVTPHVQVSEGQTVTWELEEKRIDVAPNSALIVPVIHEDDELIVIDKPVGMVVHQADGHPAPDTVVNWALAHAPSINGVGDDPLRPGIVHRLDKGVSGVMVLAKTEPMRAHLVQQFSDNAVTKEYAAICYGHLEQGEVTVDRPIARSAQGGGKMAARTRNLEAKPLSKERDAETTFMQEELLDRYTLVTAHPTTGRRHQIRVHAAAIGHPVVGDTRYAHTDLNPDRAPRLMLHATALSFTDPAGQARTFRSTLPSSFDQFIKEHRT